MREPLRDVLDQMKLYYNPSLSAERLKACCSEVFNYLLHELELAVRTAARDGFEIPENSVRIAFYRGVSPSN